MPRKLDHITMRRPGFKLVMARHEVRLDNGDIEIPPCIYRRAGNTWDLVAWLELPDHPSVKGLLKLLRKQREHSPPKWRNPVAGEAAETLVLDSVPDYVVAAERRLFDYLAGRKQP